MKVELVTGDEGFQAFSKVAANVYQNNKHYRSTMSGVEKLVLDSVNTFCAHSTIKKFVIYDGNDLVARFALIHDHHLIDYIQVSFFEAQKGLGDVFSLIQKEIATHFPHCTKAVVGLNGHINYGIGILLNHFSEPPIYGLPYNPDYYPDYFKNLRCRKMVTFRFNMDNYNSWAQSYPFNRKQQGLSVRFMDKLNIEEETAIHTMLSNRAFADHPYWATRDTQEELELFYPLHPLLENENLIFAEINGKPIGYFLWLPDFNQLIAPGGNLSQENIEHINRQHLIDTFWFDGIGIMPEYQGTSVAMALIGKALPAIMERGYKYCEGGFIFEENQASMAFAKGILKRCYGAEPVPYREYATFECTL